MTTYSAELFAHVVAFVVVQAMLLAGALVLGLVGMAITAGTRYRYWASDRPSFVEMLRVRRLLARMNWGAASLESLMDVGVAPSGPVSPWQRLPDRRPAWRRAVWIGTRLLAAAPRFVASAVRFFLRPSPLTFIALLVVIGDRDGKALRPLVSSTLRDLSTRWPMLPGAVVVASAAVVVASAGLKVVGMLRRPRLRPLTARRQAHEDECICALEEMLQSARVAADEMGSIGDEAVGTFDKS